MCLIFPRDKDVAVSTLAHPIGNGHLCSIRVLHLCGKARKGTESHEDHMSQGYHMSS